MKLKLLGLTVLLACASLHAQAVGRLADITIVDRDSGARLPVYAHRGEYWVAGRPGARYAVSVRNRQAGRVLAVASVDGVNVLSGETASWEQTGYVFSARQNYQITGWRKSDQEVAAFEFADARDSYAGRTGRPGQVGVIGVALFREQVPEQVAVPETRRNAESRDESADSTAVGAAEKRAAAPLPPPPQPNWARPMVRAKARWCRTPRSSASKRSQTKSCVSGMTAAKTCWPAA